MAQFVQTANDDETKQEGSQTVKQEADAFLIQNMSEIKIEQESALTESEQQRQQSAHEAVEFPLDDLERLDEMLGRARWIVPVLPKCELEILLDASIDLCRRQLDTLSEPCQRFFRDGLSISFFRIMNDEAVNTWKYDIYKHIYNNSTKAIELCTLKLLDDCFPLLDLLALIFNPHCKFHIANSMRSPELDVKIKFTRKLKPDNQLIKDVLAESNNESKMDPESQDCDKLEHEIFADDDLLSEDENCDASELKTVNFYTTYAKSYYKASYGWLVDFINYFGQLNGFGLSLDRFTKSSNKLTIQVIAAYLKPWGLCYQFLTPYTIKSYFVPVFELVAAFFEQLSDEDIIKECKSESKNDSISTVIKWLKLLADRLKNQHEFCKRLEMLRLKTILKILKYASFNGKMNALNEVNRVISSITCSYSSQIKSPSITNLNFNSNLKNESHEDQWLTSEQMAKWIQENDVLEIVLSDCMHQPQYVEKLERILRFLLKEKSLTLNDLDRIWESQCGKHEAIVKNVHDMLCKLAWDFSPEQLDHLFMRFQHSWTQSSTSRKQREQLLDLIRSLSEDDKEGVMADKVLKLLWHLSHNDENDEQASTELIDQAMHAHLKILDFSCASDKEEQKLKYIEKCIDNLRQNKLIIISLRQIREILQLFSDLGGINSRSEIITRLEKEHSLIEMITSNLTSYLQTVKKKLSENTQANPDNLMIDGRFSHSTQIQERLDLLKYLLKESRLCLSGHQAEIIWQCLAQSSLFEVDRDICFKWFSKLMLSNTEHNEYLTLEPECIKQFFTNFITKLDPKLLTLSGIRCFERFFKYVNQKLGRLSQSKSSKKRNLSLYLSESLDLIGLDYLWKIVSFASEENNIVDKAILLLKDIYIHLGPSLKHEQCAIHADLISSCMDRLKCSYDNLTVLTQSSKSDSCCDDQSKIQQEIAQIMRVMIVLKEYINEFDTHFMYERLYPPFSRSFRAKNLVLLAKIHVQNNNNNSTTNNGNASASLNKPVDEVELLTHLNETLGSLRRQLFARTKLNPAFNKIDLILNNESIECSTEDNKTLGDYLSIKSEKVVLIARVSQCSSNHSLSPSSSFKLNDKQANSSDEDSNNFNKNNNKNNNNDDDDENDDDNEENYEPKNNSSSENELLSKNDNSGAKNEQLNCLNLPNLEQELTLPSLILSLNEKYVEFLIALTDFSFKINNSQMRECSSAILDLLPLAKHIAEKLKHNFRVENKNIENLFIQNATQTKCWYYLKALYSLLVPSVVEDTTKQFIENYIVSGGIQVFLRLLTNKLSFGPGLNYDANACFYLLKINKLGMTIQCNAIYTHVLNAVQSKQFSLISESQHSHALLLQNSISSIPSSINEHTLRQIAQRIGQQFAAQLVASFTSDISLVIELEKLAWSLAATSSLSLLNTDIQAYDQFHEKLCKNFIAINNAYVCHEYTYAVEMCCREALECLTLSLCLVPSALDSLSQERHWRTFIIDMLLICPNRLIRQTANEQFLLQALKCSSQPNKTILFFIQMLFAHIYQLNNRTINAQNSSEYFHLLCRLLSCAHINKVKIMNVDALLNNELQWLKKLSSSNRINCSMDENDYLLDGHLNLTKELFNFQSSEKKRQLNEQFNLIQDLIESFVFPSSCLYKKFSENNFSAIDLDDSSKGSLDQLKNSICKSGSSLQSAFDLLISLCTGCLKNFQELYKLIFELFYPSLLSNIVSNNHTYLNHNDCTISAQEWEYLPPVAQRSNDSFVGLKNAGASCYMNSVLQQLFMIKDIRNSLLSVHVPSSTSDDRDLASDCDLNESMNGAQSPQQQPISRKEYNMSIFRCLQMIFGHLAEGKMQFYVPKCFWRQFRFGSAPGERVNLREQHDAVEFFNSIVDCIDETMKSLQIEQICSSVLGGVFADQKICKGCPHRYSRDESFTLLSVDIKHCSRLTESLEQYVKGDLLEGPNAYHCEKCNKKIDAIKRTCIKRLPKILAIQLKRFDYDWERDCAVKSNEYFEFPHEFDMKPYTVKGVADMDRENFKQQQQKQNSSSIENSNTLLLDYEDDNEHDEGEANDAESSAYSTHYRLVGIVVHSGQANGGHYYSFIKNRNENACQSSLNQKGTESSSSFAESDTNSGNNSNWFKFDDNDVSEFKMDDEELRNQCYGGDFTGEVYDNVLKRMAYKKQKRWWNAYIIFYERIKFKDLKQHQSKQTTPRPQSEENALIHNQINEAKNSSCLQMPAYILKSVLKKNIRFLHHRNHFSLEYIQFMKKLIQANLGLLQQQQQQQQQQSNSEHDDTFQIENEEIDDLCLESAKLAFKFLFNVGLRLKKSLRGPLNECHEALFNYAKYSYKARQWMIHYLLIENSLIFAQYLFDCPMNEIRNFISRCLVALVHLSNSDPNMHLKLKDLLYMRNQQLISVLASQNGTTTNLNTLVNTLVKNVDSPSKLDNKIFSVVPSDSLIYTLLSLLSKRDLVNEQSGKHMLQYFQFFNFYSSIGFEQCAHLQRCNVPFVITQFAIDELPLNTSQPSSPFNNYSYYTRSSQHQQQQLSHYVDLTKLYQVLSVLIRCYDVSHFCASFSSQSSLNTSEHANSFINPFSHLNELKQQQQQQQPQESEDSVELIKMPSHLADLIFKQTVFVKKMLEDALNLHETILLFKFLCYENMNFSLILLNELLWMIAYHYSYELKPHLELMYHLLLIDDSWQTRRMQCVFKGIENDRDGLFEILTKSQNHYQKRAYQIIKVLVHLFTNCECANDLLSKDQELRKSWMQARNWFQNEMEKCMLYDNNVRNYGFYSNQASPQHSKCSASNETSQTYYLERTQSARLTLERAMKICPSAARAAQDKESTVEVSKSSNELNDDDNDKEEDQGEEAYESISDEDMVDCESHRSPETQ